jgi:hypothetical protein
LYLQEKFGEYVGYFEYKTDIFNRQTMDVVSRDLIALTRKLLAAPDAPIKGAMDGLSLHRAEGQGGQGGDGLKRLLSFFRIGENA